MPWKYCENCDNELERPILEDFEAGRVPSCRTCWTPIECDKDEILIDTMLEMKAILTEIKNKLSL